MASKNAQSDSPLDSLRDTKNSARIDLTSDLQTSASEQDGVDSSGSFQSDGKNLNSDSLDFGVLRNDSKNLGADFLDSSAQNTQSPNATMQESTPKYREAVEGFSQLSLGFSVVIAVLLGVLLGMFLKNLFGAPWLLWLGVFWGVGGAVLNIYKAYKKQFSELEKLKNNPRYTQNKARD